MAQLFLSPGDQLEDGLQRSHFEDIKKVADKATNDLLLNADWEAVLACCDQVNGCLDDGIIDELVFLLRRKLGSVATVLNPVSPGQVHLTLSLVEALVKNCGTRLHKAVNDATFMTEMKKVARRYVNKAGQANVAVAELVLDITQAWGESFLTRRRQFPNIVDAYHELKKESMPFKAQYDPSRVPIFTPDGPSSGSAHADSTDAILASIAGAPDASANVSGRGSSSSSSSGGRNSNSRESREGGSSSAGDNGNRHSDGGDSSSSRGRGSDADRRRHASAPSDSLHASLRILAGLVAVAVADGDSSSLAYDEAAVELASNVTALKAQLVGQIEALLLTDETGAVAALIALNDDADVVLEAFADACEGRAGLDELELRLAAFGGGEGSGSSKNNRGRGADAAEAEAGAPLEVESFNLLQLDSPFPHSAYVGSETGRDGLHRASIDSMPEPTYGTVPKDSATAASGSLLDLLSEPVKVQPQPQSSQAPFSAPAATVFDPFASSDAPAPLTSTSNSSNSAVYCHNAASSDSSDLLDFGGRASAGARGAAANPKPLPKIAGPPNSLAPPPAVRPQQQQQPTNPFDMF